MDATALKRGGLQENDGHVWPKRPKREIPDRRELGVNYVAAWEALEVGPGMRNRKVPSRVSMVGLGAGKF